MDLPVFFLDIKRKTNYARRRIGSPENKNLFWFEACP
jgi:hypothetical protein